jgi:HlyD family secretion protein
MDRPVERDGRFSKVQKIWMGLAVAFVLFGILAYPSIRRWAVAEASIDISRVRLGVVSRGDLIRDVSVQGNIVAAFRPTMIAPARGIVRLEVKPGQVVAAGDSLMTVDSPEVRSIVKQELSTLFTLESEYERQRIVAKQSEIQMRQDIGLLEVELDAAKRAMARAERSREEGILNAVEFEKAGDELEVAGLKLGLVREKAEFQKETLAFEIRERKSLVARQRLVVTEVERKADELNIRSPVDGLVSRVMINDRDSVTEGQQLAMVVDLSAFEIDVMIPENYADEITPGTEAVITYDNQEYPGSIKSISPEVEGSRVRGVVMFSGEAPAGLKQNQRVPTRLVMETRTNIIKVPRGPFLEAGSGRQAYILDDGIAVLSPIQVGSLSVSEVEIVSGLEIGDQIIISDTARFRGAERILLRD